MNHAIELLAREQAALEVARGALERCGLSTAEADEAITDVARGVSDLQRIESERRAETRPTRGASGGAPRKRGRPRKSPQLPGAEVFAQGGLASEEERRAEAREAADLLMGGTDVVDGVIHEANA